MSYQINDFADDYIHDAVDLFLKGYKREQAINNLLPDKNVKDPGLIIQSLQAQAKNPGVSVFSKDMLVAYMLTGATFTYKNQKTAMVPEYGHGAIDEDKGELYRLMYMTLSSKWIQHSIHLHVIGHFAHDRGLQDTLFQLGFGAILTERLRDLSPIQSDPHTIIRYETDPLKLVALDREHRQFYPQAPIFINKNTEPEAIISDLTNHLENGDVFFVYQEQDIPAGYVCVGPSKSNSVHSEGFLLQDTNTAQIKSAFIKPSFRGKGAGTALLSEAITWARDNGFTRLFVEHETANYSGGKFWEQHFSSYLYFSMRYIDNTI